MDDMKTLYDFKYRTLEGQEQSLANYRGKVLLVVNTASQCGFTGQYAQLEALHQRYHDQGLQIIGFPCNQFGQQEPGSATEIGAFCQRNFGVSFSLSEKTEVNGANAHPLWQYLTLQKPGVLGSRKIKWNFTKFLIDRHGRIVGRYSPMTRPEKLAATIEKLLQS